MDYTAYSTDDFLADEFFQAFVLARDAEAERFWQRWILANPAKAAEVDEAVAVLQLLSSQHKIGPETLRREELAKLWQTMRTPGAPPARPALRSARRGQRARLWAVAAVVGAVLVVVVGVGLWRRPAPTPSLLSYATHTAEPQQITLPDGSLVVLNANSVLKLAATWPPGQAREVWLAGEAYFRVRHTAPAGVRAAAAAGAAVRFTVHAGALDVAVLGTQFNVFSRVGRTRVVLSAGQIQLSRRRGGRVEQLLMAPGELVEYDAAAAAAPLARRPVRAARYSAWTSGQLEFDNTPVPEIIDLLQVTYGLRIRLGRPALARQRLSGSVPTADLDVLLTAVGRSMDARVRRTGRQVWFE